MVQLPERKRGTRCCEDAAGLRLGSEAAEQLSGDLQILAHPVRLQILDMLSRKQGQICVCDLEAALPVKQPTISHHLKLLRDAGLIAYERRGLWVYYFVERQSLLELRKRIAERLEKLI